MRPRPAKCPAERVQMGGCELAPSLLSGGSAFATRYIPHKSPPIAHLILDFAGIVTDRDGAFFGHYHFSWSFSPPSPTPPRNNGLKSPLPSPRTEKKSNRPFWTPNFWPSASKPA
jgi:hypothetical protein